MIPITELIPNNTIKVYQIQPSQKSAKIMHVGDLPKMYDVNIHTFEIENFKCTMVNKIYNMDNLCGNLLNDTFKISLISVLYCVNDNCPVAFVSLNFHPSFGKIDKNELESKYLSSENMIINIDGFFTLSLHLNNKKMIILDDDYEYQNNDDMMADLFGYANDNDVVEIIKKYI
jgi:hypothetical protein